ncbi:unnamed protein product, partial [Tetraodon nigroviridis]
YGVKLCGREFIRAVIFTCGGSRWRRSPELGESGPPAPPLPFSHLPTMVWVCGEGNRISDSADSPPWTPVSERTAGILPPKTPPLSAPRLWVTSWPSTGPAGGGGTFPWGWRASAAPRAAPKTTSGGCAEGGRAAGGAAVDSNGK